MDWWMILLQCKWVVTSRCPR